MRRLCKRCNQIDKISSWATSKYCHDCQLINRSERYMAEHICLSCGKPKDNDYIKCDICIKRAKMLSIKKAKERKDALNVEVKNG